MTIFWEKDVKVEYPGEGVHGEQHPSWDEVTDCNDGGCANMKSTTKTQKKPASINTHEGIHGARSGVKGNTI